MADGASAAELDRLEGPNCVSMTMMIDQVCEKSEKTDVKCDSARVFNNNHDHDQCVQQEDNVPAEAVDDCRKKRCVDRYDSSESSDSGVAVLSCTDCSGSSTASSDITDPGSPFSTASTHSEDSAGGVPHKMPPTQSAHHPPWPWTTSNPEEHHQQLKRVIGAKENGIGSFSPKRLKTDVVSDTVPSPSDNDKLVNHNNNIQQKTISVKKVIESTAKFQHQGKITEYFKSQIKSSVMKKDVSKPATKIVSLVDQQTQFNSLTKVPPNRKPSSIATKKPEVKTRKSTVTVPRKILPAPSKLPDNLAINNHVPNLANFTSTVTLTAVAFPHAYIHTKSPKPPDNIFVPQYANKLNTIPCLNVLQPVQKITTLNNFNLGVKLNATMVPIVKLNQLNALPARITSPNLATVPFSIDTALPTVLTAKPKTAETTPNSIIPNKPNHTTNLPQTTPTPTNNCRNEEKEQPYRTEESQCREPNLNLQRNQEKSPTPDSDSGISTSPKECLQISVGDETLVVPEQKSPILSQPKTIRFPAKRDLKEDQEAKSQVSQDGVCRWTDCAQLFTTSGALFDHLQVKHVISQASQEHYVCLWEGCKVHGRTSCSRSWLERHVLAHAGTKPFRCIVDGCGQRFNSQIMLERHVNGHFNSDGTQNGSAKKSTENGNVKLFKRNGKKIRFRRQPWSARMFDFIDAGIMEGLQHKLLMMTQKRTLGKISNAGDTVNLQSQILARRTDVDGSTKILVRWHPADVIPDEWIAEKEYKPTKLVSIPVLDPSAKDALKPTLFPIEENAKKMNISGASKRKRHRRLPLSNQT